MGINRFFNTVVRMFWLVILLGAIGGGISVYTGYYNTVPMYEAETTVYAMSKKSVVEGRSISLSYEDVLLSKQLVQESQDLITSDRVLELASEKLEKYQITSAQLKSMISVTPKSDSSVIVISALAYEPQIAADVSTEVTKAFISRLHEITNSNIVGVLNAAKEPLAPIQNNRIKNILIGIIAGIVAAVVIIYIRELFDTTIRYIEDVEHVINLKVVGVIPKYGIK